MIIRYYDSDLTFQSSEQIDYYTDYETLKAGGGAKFISFPNQRFARALRQTQMLYIHGIGAGTLLQNEEFQLIITHISTASPWVFTQNSTSDTANPFLNTEGGGNGPYFLRTVSNNSLDGTEPERLLLISQTGAVISSAGASTQLRLSVRARLVYEDGLVDPAFSRDAYWYMRHGTKYFNASAGTWVGSLVWNEFTGAFYGNGVFFDWNTYTFTTPIITETGSVEVGVTGISGIKDTPPATAASGIDYDFARVTVITAGVAEDHYSSNFRANINTRASLVESVGTVLNADGPTNGNVARLTRDSAGEISTISWGGLPLQDVIVRRWLGVLRANRRMVEGEMIGIDPLGRINRGLFYRGRFFAPVFAEWLARSRTWRVRLHEYATNEEGVTNTLSREDNRRNKSGDIYEAPEIIS